MVSALVGTVVNQVVIGNRTFGSFVYNLSSFFSDFFIL